MLAIILSVIVGLMLFCTFKSIMSNEFRIAMIFLIFSLFRDRHPVVDGNRIFIVGNTWKRKLIISAERLQSKIRNGQQPAGCYQTHCNQIYITPYAMLTRDNHADCYGTEKSITRIANIISHEFNHMLFNVEHGSFATIGLDSLCGYADDLNNAGLSD